jgi:hypothetical protein
MAQPLMPKATAVWLVENTTLTFDQIADFCVLHPLEVQGIADGEVAVGIVGMDPIANGQITRDEITRGEADATVTLKGRETDVPPAPRRKGPRYTPVSKRGDRPDAISWLLKYTPELTNAQICRLIGTTKPTIEAVRTRTHWNISNIQARDPVLLGICSQSELEEQLTRARRRIARKEGDKAAAPAAEAPVGEAPTMEDAAPEPAPATEPADTADAATSSMPGSEPEPELPRAVGDELT